MRRKGSKIRGELINATFQGYFDPALIQQQQELQGCGILIDDQFNFFMGTWEGSHLHGPSFIRTTSGINIYGQFRDSTPQATTAVQLGQHHLYMQPHPTRNATWKQSAVLINQQSNILYILSIGPRTQDSDMDLDRTQKISTSSKKTNKSISKNQWKIKVVDRCLLRSDGSLSGFSKYLKKRSKKYESIPNYTPQQQNHINLIDTVFQGQLKEPSIINACKYIKEMAEKDPRIDVDEIKQGNTAFIHVSTSRDRKAAHNKTHNLGLVLNKNGQSRSLGNYCPQGNLNGLAIEYKKKGQAFCGIFKNNLLAKQYSHSPPSQPQQIITPQLRQLLYQQHLKSINFLNNCHYLPTLEPILQLSHKIFKYVSTFEKQFQKRHLSYNDTDVFGEVSSDNGNILKYVEEREPPKKETETVTPHDQQTKRIGFIIRQTSKSRSPSKPSPSRSPKARVVGTITSRNNLIKNMQMDRGGSIKGYQGPRG